MFRFFILLAAVSVINCQWPIPYEPVPFRPENDAYCQAGMQPFCPTGTQESMPLFDEDDVIEVFALKKPVWSFKYGPLLGYFNIMHDGVGFRSQKTGFNYTMEWYELDQLFNCTFPHTRENNIFTWCNQGALCVYDGIVDHVWTDYGFIKKVSEVPGPLFNKFAQWSLDDNNTRIFYETWTVYSSHDALDKNTVMYFDSFDCASWVLRAFDSLYTFGARFDPEAKLNYTRLNLYSYEPILIGTYSDIFNSKNETLIDDVVKFYKDFQKPNKEFLPQFLDIFTYFTVLKRFYFYYNEKYWLLNLKSPYVNISYDNIPLPGTE